MMRAGAIRFSFLVIFCVAPGMLAQTQEQREKLQERYAKFGMECLKEIQIEEEDIANIKERKPLTGANTPCFLACVYRKTGLLGDNGMLQTEAALERLKQLFEETEYHKKAQDYLLACTSEVNAIEVSDGAKGCERAHKAYNCLIEKAPQFGIVL